MRSLAIGTAALSAAVASVSFAQVPFIRNDIAYGLNRNNPAETLHQIRGFPTGTRTTSEWGVNFLQGMYFDHTNGLRHNPAGNLLGLDFGAAATGGRLHTLDTRFAGGTNPGASQRIFDFTDYNDANPGAPLTVSRLAGMSVSPQNNRVIMTGNDSGLVYVFDYTPGNSQGAGTPLTNGREIGALVPGASNTQGSAWLDNDNAIVLNANGEMQRITVGGGGALSVSTAANITLPGDGAPFTSMAYEPTLSPYVFATAARFASGVTTNTVFVLDPNNNFSIVEQLDYSTSVAAKSIRQAAFDSNGNLFIGNFMNTTSTPLGESIQLVANAVDVGALTDNNSVAYYTQNPVLSAQFSGLDVASKLVDYKSAGVTVDIEQQSIVQRYFGTTPINEVRQKVQTGYNGGQWDGDGGILSSDAAANAGYAVGFGDAGNLGLIGQDFGGETVGGPAVLFRYTRYGDANLDGVVNLADFNRLAANFGSAGAAWHLGDFNFDGLVNLADFNLLAANFGQQAGPDGPTPDDWAALASAIPEPTALGVFGTAGLALLARRRK